MSSNEPRLRVITPDSSGRSPVIRSIRSAWAGSSDANAEPTVPWPSTPTRNVGLSDVTGRQVVVGLAPHGHPGGALAAEDHRRPRHAVVVVGQRVAIGAGHRRNH